MGAIVSRKKRTAVIASQPAAAFASLPTAATATPQPSNQASRTDTQSPILGSHDSENESDAEEKSEESDKSESEPESNDEDNQSEHNSAKSESLSSRSNESIKKTSSTPEVKEAKQTVDEGSSEEEFADAWRKALLEDMDINISDNVKIVRIFTSSTFTDTFVERNTLMERVYPRLKSYCQERGYDFQVVDMRWGVRDESTDDHMTTELCMRELRACQKLSTGPNFITFLGQKYGYRPFPAKIAASEFEKLLGAVDNKDDVQLLKKWFWRDDNAVPAQYLLQPITSLLPHYRDYENNELRKKASADWWAAFERMQVALRMAAEKVLEEDDRHKYHMSVTEDEIRRGIITVSTPQKHCFWFKRVITDLIKNADDRNAGKFVDKNYGTDHSSIDESAQHLLSNLREKVLPTALPATNVLQYDVQWTKEGISPNASAEHAEYLEKLCTDVFNVLSSMIQEAIDEKETSDNKDSVAEEVLQHALFCQRKGLSCHGRGDFLQLVRQSLLVNDKRQVVILHGESGCGKTSIMAKIAVEIRKWLKPESAMVVLRFIGTSPESSSIRLLLRSVCHQLYTITDNDVGEIPEDLMELLEFFPKCLDEACTFRPVVLMLDSLDQLPAGGGGRRLDWLPRKLPDNFYLIFSTLPGPEYECLPHLKALFAESCFKEVPAIPLDEADLILESWLSSSQRTLTSAQKEVVLRAFQECPLPLYLKLSFDSAFRWKSFTPANETKLASNVKNVIHDFLDQVERRHGKILVCQALAYITASKNGLTEPELEDVLSLDDEVLNDVYQYWTPPVRRLPPLLWIRIRSDVGDYLIERGADDARVVYWYHRQFIEVATDRYLGVKKEEIHSKLADFFTGKWSNGSGKPYVDKDGETVLKDRLVARQPLMFHNKEGRGPVYNLRKLNELPYHLLHAGDPKRLKEESLCNFEFLLTKIRAMTLESVLDDFTSSLVLYPEDEDFVLLEKTLQLSSVALKADPNQLASQLLGRLISIRGKGHISSIDTLLQQAYSSSVPCLIPSDNCLTSPGGSLISSMKIPGESTSQCCGFSCDGKTAYVATSSSSLQLQVMIVDLQTGKTIQRVTIPESEDVGLVWTIQGGHLNPDLLLLAGSADICLLKTSTGQIVQKFSALAQESQYSPMPPVSFVDNDTRIVAITDEDLKIWTVKDGRLVHQIDVGKISTDEEYGTLGASGYLAAYSVHVSRSFKVLNCRTGKELRDVRVFSDADACCIAEVKVTSKEQVVVTSSERNNLRLYDIHSGDLIREVPQFRINSGHVRLQVTEDGTKAVGIADYEILITNLEDGSVYKTLKSKSFGTLIIHQNFYTRDGKFGISIAHDDVIRIYDLKQAVKEMKKDVSTSSKNHKAVSSVDSITYLFRGSDERHVIATATVNDSNEVLVWDTLTGTKVRALKITQDVPPSTIRMQGTDHAVGYIHDQDFLHFQVFDLKAGKVNRCLQGKASKRTEAFGFTDDSHIISFSRGRRNLKVWNINDGKLVKQYKFGQKYRFEDMLVSRNGKAVVCSQVGQTVEHDDDDDTMPLAFLNPQSGEKKILEEKNTQLLLWRGSIADDGRYLVCLTKDYNALLWDLTSGRLMHRLKADEDDPTVVATAISPTSNVVLTGPGDGGINVWDIASGRLQYTFVCDDVDSLFVTQDGRVAFSNYRSSNRNIDAWDLSTGLKLASFTSDWKPERMVVSGNRLVVAKADKPELMSLRPHIPGYPENVPNEDSPFKGCPLESQLQPSQEYPTGRDGDEDEDDDDDADETDIQKTELTRKAVYASPNVIIGGGSSVFASKSIFISGNVTINGIPIQDL